MLSETGSPHLQVIAEEVSRVANVLRNNSDAARGYNIEAVKNREFAVSPSQPFVEQTMQCRLTQKFGFGIFAPNL